MTPEDQDAAKRALAWMESADGGDILDLLTPIPESEPELQSEDFTQPLPPDRPDIRRRNLNPTAGEQA